MATNYRIQPDLVSERVTNTCAHAHTNTHTAYVAMEGLERVHNIESVHVHNGCIDA